MFKVKTDKNWLILVWEIDWVVIVLQDKKYLLQKAYCSVDRWVLNTTCTWTCSLLPVLSVALTWLWMRCLCFEERRANRGGESWGRPNSSLQWYTAYVLWAQCRGKLKCVWPCISGDFSEMSCNQSGTDSFGVICVEGWGGMWSQDEKWACGNVVLLSSTTENTHNVEKKRAWLSLAGERQAEMQTSRPQVLLEEHNGLFSWTLSCQCDFFCHGTNSRQWLFQSFSLM